MTTATVSESGYIIVEGIWYTSNYHKLIPHRRHLFTNMTGYKSVCCRLVTMHPWRWQTTYREKITSTKNTF